LKLIRRHDETWQFGFSNKDEGSEIEREGIVAKILRPHSFGGTACVTALTYSVIDFMRKELCRQGKSVLLWTLS